MVQIFNSSGKEKSNTKKKKVEDSALKKLLSEEELRKFKLYGTIVLVLFFAALLSIGLTWRSTPLGRCERIVFSIQKYNCITYLANYTGNATMCRNILSAQNVSCIEEVAITSSKISSCDLISSKNEQSECGLMIAQNSKNSSYCKELEQPYASQCAYYIESDQGFDNKDLCGLIVNSSEYYYCIYSYYKNTAFSTGNSTYCSDLPESSPYISSSFYEDSNLSESTPYSAAILEENLTPRDYCYYNVAQIDLNQSICAKINGTQDEALCAEQISDYNSSAYNVTYNLTNSSRYDNLTVANIKDICNSYSYPQNSTCKNALFLNKAVDERNLSLCSQIGNNTYDDYCIASVALAYNDTGYCEYIVNATLKNVCYLDTENQSASNSIG